MRVVAPRRAEPTTGSAFTGTLQLLRPSSADLTDAAFVLGLGLVDKVVREPIGGAHRKPKQMARRLKAVLVNELDALEGLPVDTLLEQRYRRLRERGARSSKTGEYYLYFPGAFFILSDFEPRAKALKKTLRRYSSSYRLTPALSQRSRKKPRRKLSSLCLKAPLSAKAPMISSTPSSIPRRESAWPLS